jgi:hypothetical protein
LIIASLTAAPTALFPLINVNPFIPFGAFYIIVLFASLGKFLSEIESNYEPLMIAASTSALPMNY